jgi:hypothetical protein
MGMWERTGFAAEQPRRLSLVLFPTLNRTDFQVWESRYYPYSILERKMTEELALLFESNPRIDVLILDETGMNRWLASPFRQEDLAAQMELVQASQKQRNLLGQWESSSVMLRVRIFDAANAEQFGTDVARGRDKRYTFDPGASQLFFLNAIVLNLPVPFTDGVDWLGLTGTRDKGQSMTYPLWNQFHDSSQWQGFKNAIAAAKDEIMGQVERAMRRSGTLTDEGPGDFGAMFTEVGRIISPTAKSTRRRREYIISLGNMDSVQVGDVLDVVRSDTYVTVDPERPVVLIPNVVGKVRVTWAQAHEAIVVVIQDKDRRNPIQLKDLVVKSAIK